ncbi:MAG: hypothetical protein GWP14_02080 [Actinobacteria bacterium]|nr:hypothetical protein [Actinomycetota bacterium]
MVNKKTWIFILWALLVSVLLAIFISPFASSSPDGLEKVAEDKGFLNKAEDHEPAWNYSLIPDYAVGGIKNESIATGLAGLIGTLLTFAVGLGLAKVMSRKRRT